MQRYTGRYRSNKEPLPSSTNKTAMPESNPQLELLVQSWGKSHHRVNSSRIAKVSNFVTFLLPSKPGNYNYHCYQIGFFMVKPTWALCEGEKKLRAKKKKCKWNPLRRKPTPHESYPEQSWVCAGSDGGPRPRRRQKSRAARDTLIRKVIKFR